MATATKKGANLEDDGTTNPPGDGQPTNPPTNPPATPPANDGGERTVPYARFKSVNDEKRALEAKIAELTGAATDAEGLRTQLTQLQTQIARQNAAATVNLPTELLPYVQGTTAEEMAASAKFLADRLAGTNAPNINAGDVHNQPPTFTLSQLLDAKFFRENEAAIMQAQRDGRIVQG